MNTSVHVQSSNQQQLQQQQQQQHQMTNKAVFACDIPGCDKKFGRNCELTRHKLNHMDIWPFLCDYPNCGRKFKRKDVYKNHQRTHIKEDNMLMSNNLIGNSLMSNQSLMNNQTLMDLSMMKSRRQDNNHMDQDHPLELSLKSR